MDLLADMFPEIAPGMINQVLSTCDGDAERAADWILSGRHLEELGSQIKNDNSVSESPKKHEEPHRPKSESIGSSSLLTKRLKELLTEGVFADVCLVCKDGEVLAHAAILAARSEFLSAVIGSLDLKSSARPCRIDIFDNVEVKVVKFLLEYLYFDKSAIPQEFQWKLNSAAADIGLARLQHICEGSATEESSLSDDLFKLRQAPLEYYSDVTVSVEGRRIPGHKIILCSASEYFKTMYTVSMVEATQSTATIEEVSFQDFSLLLDIIYRDGKLTSGTISPDNAVDMFFVANRLIVTPLQLHCEDIINNNIEEENACEILEMAWSASSSLKHVTMQFIFEHYENVKKTQGYKALPESISSELEQRYTMENENALLNLLRAVSDKEVSDIRSSIRMEVFEFLKDQLEEMNVDDEGGEADTPFGDVEWAMSNLRVTTESDDDPFLKPEDIDVIFNHKQLVIDVTNLRVKMNAVQWYYKKMSFPRVEDDGEATACLSGINIQLAFNITSQLLGIPLLEVDHFNVVVGSFDLNLRNTKLDFLYNILAKAFKDRIRLQIQKQLENLFAESLTQLTTNINQLSRQLCEGNGSSFRDL